MIVVCNTTPILSLLKINCLNLLEKMFGQIFISEGVFLELIAKDKHDEEILKYANEF
ncbi:hypothetical protein ABG79_00612 [Caloramator mitchellensis]|uniref:PIN domain-containing protein n=1 Tax=Caloramator mitchellensis TaxID=908809 RepID=A0A0R3K5Z0_CALMK|nr:hypothetical protein [Caloramator mitchellensis]KRQ87807.1 hypothetical protein ABG79_00612 [Caloramator mitchellensis]